MLVESSHSLIQDLQGGVKEMSFLSLSEPKKRREGFVMDCWRLEMVEHVAGWKIVRQLAMQARWKSQVVEVRAVDVRDNSLVHWYA